VVHDAADLWKVEPEALAREVRRRERLLAGVGLHHIPAPRRADRRRRIVGFDRRQPDGEGLPRLGPRTMRLRRDTNSHTRLPNAPGNSHSLVSGARDFQPSSTGICRLVPAASARAEPAGADYAPILQRRFTNQDPSRETKSVTFQAVHAAAIAGLAGVGQIWIDSFLRKGTLFFGG
jgi:hypothetical protein